ncbi:hypothetical protein Lesp02_15660 [Lentzea sp. NBRC 105346]|nr:hypothetical protein Lesp02_15660 [Lentzea sp. NBRC 105346]
MVALRPRNVVGWLLLAAGTCQVLFIGLMAFSWYGLTIADPAWSSARWTLFAGAGLFVPGWLVLPTLLISFYPDGRLPARWWRWPVGGAATGILLLTVIASFDPHAYIGTPGAPPLVVPEVVLQILLVGICLPLIAGSTVIIWIGTVVRFVRARSPERQQLAWLACVVGAFLAISQYGPAKPLLTVIAFGVPVAIAVGVMRYRLLGIAVVLRRGLVYVVLTSAVVVVYLAFSAVAAQALDRTPIPGVMAAAVVAVGLTPARDQLQRAVDRFIYGRRPDPVQALGHLGNLVAEADEAELLHTALRSVAGSVGATGAAVVADGHVVSSVGTDPAGYEIGPLRFGGQDLGTLRLATRYAPPQSRGQAERRLHAALTSQVAVVVQATRLAEELKAERDRVVTATRNERERLRRDLHDGLGPSLSGVSLGLQALGDAVETGNKAVCTALLERISTEVATAVLDIRRIIEDLRPAALDQLGLADAVSRHAASLAGSVTVTVTTAGPRGLPPNVETAAYRIVTEALTNITRHANARHARVDISTNDQTLRLSIADDGDGGADTGSTGVGLTSMHRRAEALHGSCTVESTAVGTTVVVTLPLDKR